LGNWLNPLGVAYHIYIISVLQWYNTHTHIQKLYSLTLGKDYADVCPHDGLTI
jgi:hypothetical protein